MKIIGILNVTPDSFSDGGEFTTPEAAFNQVNALISDGSDIVEIGGDSTRPSSICVGQKAELARISPILSLIKNRCKFGIDTHNVEVARIALEYGATYVNDISGGEDDQMLTLIAERNIDCILMSSRCTEPHNFGISEFKEVNEVLANINRIINRALSFGIKKEKIIIDPGMGNFMSSNPNISFNMIASLNRLPADYRICLGLSRKSFLAGETGSIKERDFISSFIEATLATTCTRELFFRTHNPAKLKEMYRSLSGISSKSNHL